MHGHGTDGQYEDSQRLWFLHAKASVYVRKWDVWYSEELSIL